ncbi:hypothetical protein HPP92_007369 [Vanilla planifolia]|uniref:Phospholipid/glycerol acyltransferase domain-containing protein n=1 Tax=Vanilla planifolia TaxID=51239 RepID=A0A835V8M5_VANPL|nr:hypothetical protein HPP92_007369 [Vanilla planifolia]
METFPRLKVAFPIPLLRLGWNKSCHTILRRNFNSFSGFTSCQLSRNFELRSLTCSRPSKSLHISQRSAIVRSQIATVNSPGDEARILSGDQLVSRIRGMCFYSITTIIAIPLVVVMLLVHPVLMILDRHRRRIHHFIAKIWATLTIYPFYRFEFEGLHNLPPHDSPAVYVSNHQSFLDIYTLLTLGRSFKFISKTGVFYIPIIGWAMFLMGIIPLRRMDSRSQLECLKLSMDRVRKGASVFFFPEGTRSKDGKLGAFKKGAFSVAAKTEAPVVPITILGTGQLMPAGMEGILRSGSVKVVIHKPVKGTDADLLCKESRHVIADTLIHHGYGIHYD